MVPSKLPETLVLKLKNLPTSPGVYQFKNKQGKIIYIGKAKNLKNRVRTYFQKSGHLDPKTRRMISQVVDLELMVTDNEIESLILEANLVHEFCPRYNIRLKDDKHFPYIRITTQEAFPRMTIVRRLARDGATYFGPYTSAKLMRQTFSLLTRLFRIRSCNLVLPPPEGKKYQVCLDYHINLCGGPCEGLQSQEDYAEGIKAVIMVLSGRAQKLIAELTARMQKASQELDFELAKTCRDQITALEAAMIRQRVDAGEVVDRDIISIAREGKHALAVVLQLREGVLIGRQHFQLMVEPDDTAEAILDAFLGQYYHHQPNLPEEVCLPWEASDMKLLASWLKKMRGRVVKVITPQIGEKSKLVRLAKTNARLLLDELLIQKRTQQERTSKMVLSLKEELHLTQSPRRIVCFDISNMGETDVVGSCVYFHNGQPKKNEYRHFNIKGLQGQDDFRNMREIIGRYFFRLREKDQDIPDLVVVDGGKGQLSAALAELHSLGFNDQLVLGLAKRLEEVYLPNRSDPLTIPKSSPALMLLKRLRDEAHRFAIEYNRKVRTKRTLKSALDDIPGIGPAKRVQLLKKFGSVSRIKRTPADKLAETPGITPVLAKKILDHLTGPG